MILQLNHIFLRKITNFILFNYIAYKHIINYPSIFELSSFEYRFPSQIHEYFIHHYYLKLHQICIKIYWFFNVWFIDNSGFLYWLNVIYNLGWNGMSLRQILVKVSESWERTVTSLMCLWFVMIHIYRSIHTFT